MKKKNLYYISGSSSYYNYHTHCLEWLVDIAPTGLYKRAYSRKQAINYITRDIAMRCYCKPYDIDIDPYDVKMLEE